MACTPENSLEKGAFSKRTTFVADVMAEWYSKQCSTIARGAQHTQARQSAFSLVEPEPIAQLDRRLLAAREEMRELVEIGELDSACLNDSRVLEWAFA